jgi:pyruvate dehydrogenase E2 component (dihydrolipoamide acetyltransferase)
LGDDSKEVKVGDLIALMVAEGEDWNDVQVPGKKVVQSPVTKVDDVQKPKAEAKTTSESIDRHS